jgi:Uma2 family endonuclease
MMFATAEPTSLEQSKLASLEEMQAMEAENKLIEFSDGIWEEQAVTSIDHSRIGTKLLIKLGVFVETHGLGEVYGPDLSYVLQGEGPSAGKIRLPDVSFVKKDRVQRDLTGYYYLSPDLAVEIISHTERAGKVATKLQEYQAAGVAQIWLIYPSSQEVIVHAGPDVQVYEIEDTLTGGDLFPGFELSLKTLFE